MFVIPMAGMSSRFTKAGYTKPKYMLDLNGSPLFDYCVASFKVYFKTDAFLFIARSEAETENFIKQRCAELGIEKFEIVILDSSTQGQAETVALGLSQSTLGDDSGITIFNIDTIRQNYQHPVDAMLNSEGFLEVFSGEGDNWSFAELESEDSNNVIRTTEKDPISQWCSTGLYFFSGKQAYLDLFAEYSKTEASRCGGGEYYIAPMYNLLIAKEQTVKVNKIGASEVLFSGIPSEYEALKTQSIEL
jgi:NDP-sugar pyrophosphorylase family protein